MNKKENNFLLQGSILAISGIIVRFIGLAYRIPLMNIVGDKGMGYYATAFNIYQIILLLSSYSLPIAVSKMISFRLGLGQHKNAHRIFILALIYATIVGFIGSSVAFFYADYFAEVVFKLPYSNLAIKTLAPTIWVVSYLGVFRGYYQARSNMLPSAMSQIIEQIINALVSVYSAYYLSELALKTATGADAASYGAAGGTLGTGLGALSALIFFLILYTLGRKERSDNFSQDRNLYTESYASISKVLIFTVLPVIASTAVYNINSIIDLGIFSRAMIYFNRAEETAALYGLYTGAYIILTNLPIAISNSVASSLIPSLSQHIAVKDMGNVHKKIGTAVKFSMLISIPAAIGLSVLAEPIIRLLFPRELPAVGLLRYGSISVVFFSLSTISNAILQGCNFMKRPLRNAIISLFLHIVTFVILLYVFKLGVYALVFAHIAFALFMCILNASSIKKLLNYKQEIGRSFIRTSIAGIIMGVVSFIALRYIEFAMSGFSIAVRLMNLIYVLFVFIIAIISYTLAVYKLGVLSDAELKALPVIGKRLRNI